jgi:hypothetical protein
VNWDQSASDVPRCWFIAFACRAVSEITLSRSAGSPASVASVVNMFDTLFPKSRGSASPASRPTGTPAIRELDGCSSCSASHRRSAPEVTASTTSLSVNPWMAAWCVRTALRSAMGSVTVAKDRRGVRGPLNETRGVSFSGTGTPFASRRR